MSAITGKWHAFVPAHIELRDTVRVVRLAETAPYGHQTKADALSELKHETEKHLRNAQVEVARLGRLLANIREAEEPTS